MSVEIRVHGVREVSAAFRTVDRKLASDFGGDLKKAAEPVAVAGRQKVTRFQGASVKTIRTKRSGPRVFVEQGARKVTGNRGDFGALQMRTVLVPALEEQSDEVFDNVEKVLEHYARVTGF